MADFTCGRLLSCPFHMLQYPGDLGRREVGGEVHAGSPADVLRLAQPLHPLADVRRPGTLPYDGVPEGSASGAVPRKGRLPLVADADAGDTALVDAGLVYEADGRLDRIAVDLLRIVGDPSLLIHDLDMGLVGPADQAAAPVKEEGLRPLGALVYADDIFVCHVSCSFTALFAALLFFRGIDAVAPSLDTAMADALAASSRPSVTGIPSMIEEMK